MSGKIISTRNDKIRHIAKKYETMGWTVITVGNASGTSTVDLMVQRARTLHFIKCVESLETTAELSDLPRNSYIQNAFSNNAVPVYATVNSATGAVALANVNTNETIMLKPARSAKTIAGGATNATAGSAVDSAKKQSSQKSSERPTKNAGGKPKK